MYTEKTLHVVAFDVPFPPDYGGVSDVYYRCRALKNAGYRVLLHCFEYGRGTQHDPAGIADDVFYYPRRKNISDWFSPLPFIVKTRNAPELLKRLQQDEHPIVFEGQHTTFFLDHPALRNRRKIVRLHNIEWQYYAGLAKRTGSLPKKLFFRSEARKLKKQEAVLKYADTLACISHSDTLYYRDRFRESVYVPVGFELHPETLAPSHLPPFVLLHGNLSVPENHEAALWVLEAFREYAGDTELVIAGKDPHNVLSEKCSNCPGITLIPNPDAIEMRQLVQSAQAHLAISFQHSGIKIKLLNALLSGKPCIATPEMVEGSGLEAYCTIVETQQELLDAVQNRSELSEAEQRERIAEIRELFSEETWLEVVAGLWR